MGPAAEQPIFIIGCARSGTTLLRMMLDSHPRISCGEETKFLTDLEPIVTTHWPLLRTYGFERAWWIERIRDFYAGFQGEYLARRGKARWAEKTPEYTLHMDFLDELFPDARYLHVVRDGHDVVSSFRDRWGYKAGVRAANSVWAHTTGTARRFGASVPGRYHEIRYERLVSEPEPTARAIFEFLGEEWDAQVLRFDEVAHDTTERYARFTSERRRQGDDEGTIYRSRVGAGKRALDPVLHWLLHRSGGRLLTELGYDG